MRPDGAEIAAVDMEGQLSICTLGASATWQVMSHVPRLAVGGSGWMSYSPDGKTLCCIDRTTEAVMLVNVASQTFSSLPVLPGTKANCVAFSSDGKLIAAACDSAGVFVWNCSDLKIVQKFATEGPVRAIAFRPGFHELATFVMKDNRCVVLDVKTGEQRYVTEGHKETITCLNYTHDGLRLITGSFDRTVRVWDAESGEGLLVIDGAPTWIRKLTISRDNRQIAFYCKIDELENSEILFLGGSDAKGD